MGFVTVVPAMRCVVVEETTGKVLFIDRMLPNSANITHIFILFTAIGELNSMN